MKSGKRSSLGKSSNRVHVSPKRSVRVSAEANLGESAARSNVAPSRGKQSVPYSAHSRRTVKGVTSTTRPVVLSAQDSPVNITKMVESALCQHFSNPTASSRDRLMYLQTLEVDRKST